ncbi:MAG TPA: GAF domain-containing protein [Puia sp.]|nr:GAF domain-containing protein [Puia sp.]
MQKDLINIAEELEGFDVIDSHLSFKGFLNFLRDLRSHEKTMKVRFLESVISSFEHRLPPKNELGLEEMEQYEDLLQWVYALLFPPINDERQNLWALSMPMKPVIFYGTNAFYHLLKNEKTGESKICLIDREEGGNKKINIEHVYSFILKRLYNHDYLPGNKLIHSYYDQVTGVSKFYKLDIDARFVDIIPKKGSFPMIGAELKARSHDPTFLEFLKEKLPLSLFRFEGISAISFTDITGEQATENIKNIILDRNACEMDSCHDRVIHSLKALAGNNEVEFGLLPFLKVNGKVVFSGETLFHSIISAAAKKYEDAERNYLAMVDKYFQNPKMIFFETLPAQDEKFNAFLDILRKNGVVSYALLPVFYNNKLAGAMEVYSKKEGILDHGVLSRVEQAIPLLAQLLQRSIVDFDEEIRAVVKENYTAVQPSVEWKFYETAWHFLRDHFWKGDASGLEPIHFKDVYPLYGAVDIRNSTIERNEAFKKDLQTQFDILLTTLSELEKGLGPGLLDILISECRKWADMLPGFLTTAEEMELNEFLKNEVGFFFHQLRGRKPDLAPIIDVYLGAIDESEGIAFRNRRDLENSIQLINKSINSHLETAVSELQQSYPFYFEKFRTDGVEYDIYVGQSITPDRPFDIRFLKELRLWQLRSMATVAGLAHELLPEMPDKLQTTQLIFVHSSAIDISFRQDERRFDVEGSYNIRYEIVKKRIDKVHLRGGVERLTQPGKIAVIYFNEREAEEYIGYIRELQTAGILKDDLEQLDLEELQGVTGLKACRIGVNFS